MHSKSDDFITPTEIHKEKHFGQSFKEDSAPIFQYKLYHEYGSDSQGLCKYNNIQRGGAWGRGGVSKATLRYNKGGGVT